MVRKRDALASSTKTMTADSANTGVDRTCCFFEVKMTLSDSLKKVERDSFNFELDPSSFPICEMR